MSADDVEKDLQHLHEISPDSAESLRRMQRLIIEREVAHEPLPTAQSYQRPMQLPIWPEPVRGAPNTLLRSAFFAAIHSKKRRELGTKTKPEKKPEGVTVAAQEGILIKYAGTQLNQYDADVFFEALHRARHHPLETECFFRGYDFLKAIGRSDGKLNYEDLDEGLDRLRRGTVDLEWKVNGHHYIFTGSLISSYVREKNSKLYKVTFAKEIRDLFAPACWTQLEWEERQALRGKPLAQWLHSYFCTHAAAYPVSAAFLHEKTGSARGLLKHFRGDLKGALATLEKELGWKAVWDSDLVILKRPLSPSQVRHLASTPQMGRKKRPKSKSRGLIPVGDLLARTRISPDRKARI
jgi:hypothetical protein